MKNWMAAAVAVALVLPPCGGALASPVAAQKAKSGKKAKSADADADEDGAGSEKYFVFHKDGVTLEQAMADFAECRGYTDGIRSTGTGPDYSFMQNPYLVPPNAAGAAGGLLGALIAGAIYEATVAAPERAGIRRANLRVCMAFKDYDRFATTKSQWEKLHEGDDQDAKIARLAAFAAGPRPEGEVLSK